MMYKDYFSLQRDPFEITPDPYFLVRTEKHDEALAALHYGVSQHKGFIVMTGEMGTGKTLLIRCLLEMLSEQKVAYAYVFNSRLSALEFLQYVAADLGLPTVGDSKGEILMNLGSYLVSRYQRNLTTVLVVDEAHHVSTEVLEEIRLLTNLETARQKLLQIVLAGQPELDQKLESPQLQQLKQRITVRSELSPLNRLETERYINRRLQLASDGRRNGAILCSEAMDRIYFYSEGIPRIINTLCENALITASIRKEQFVTIEIIDKVAMRFRLHVQHVRPKSIGSDEIGEAMRTLRHIHQRLQSTRRDQ
jgi:general secretion pathway protein A